MKYLPCISADCIQEWLLFEVDGPVSFRDVRGLVTTAIIENGGDQNKDMDNRIFVPPNLFDAVYIPRTAPTPDKIVCRNTWGMGVYA